MCEVGHRLLLSSGANVASSSSSSRRWKGRMHGVVVVRPKWRCSSSPASSKSSQPSVKSDDMMPSSSTFSSTITTDIPLYEPPGISFDDYLNDRPRVFQAIFPDKRRSQRLNEEEWRIQMLPIEFFFFTVLPVIDMRVRCKSHGKDYPPGVPLNTTKVLELDVTRWELQGLDTVLKPSDFTLGVRGSLYPDRRGVRTRLKGDLETKISFVLPPMLAVIPEDVLRGVAESLLNKLVENMKSKVNGSLLSDFRDYKREMVKRSN
ncbi:hypothetical protein GIB67_007306 [Kingdonia uniflora]|uniref:DUF1997 family protein n=1 Tax=Kingdonia uniflora TaxID=39325 RepID=A0A7J7NX58_9MAGN|nr:hypothetical protein GIB67_007306 [Kingdonia uniflora]